MQAATAQRTEAVRPAAGHPLGALFAPLDFLLARGGDPRLALDPETRMNAYGCRPFPHPEAIGFSSSTATSVSQRAYMRAGRARRELIEAACVHGIAAAFDRRCEAMRAELLTHLGLGGTGTDVVFAPSGTDAQLAALFAARALLGPRLASVVVAPDESGSGTRFTALGRHFAGQTAQGVPVIPDMPVAGLGEGLSGFAIAAGDASDTAVSRTVSRAAQSGRKVFLLAMDCSKLGRRAPGAACLDALEEKYAGRLLIAVDACQMRLGRARLRHHLDRGRMVLATGSKFFTGPPFSGALLVPASLSPGLAAVASVPPGFCDYANASDWPGSWRGIRAALPQRMNFGQWLRWEAALEEMRAYFAVPQDFRARALMQFGETVADLVAKSPVLELLPASPNAPDGIDAAEMPARTVFAFRLRRGAKTLPPEECARIYRALRRDMSRDLPLGALAHQRSVAARLCHIGQPVTLADGSACLRMAAGARLVSDAWSADEATAARNLAAAVARIGAVVEKLELLLTCRETDHDA